MRLPALRLAFLHGLRSSGIADLVLGTVLVLPADLPEVEREEICDLIALAVGRPVHVAARRVDLPVGHVCVLTEPIEAEPAPVNDEVLIAVRAPQVGRRRVGIPNELRLLRDAVLQVISAEQPGGRLEDIAGWAQVVADSPSTALRFASAARGHALAHPRASDAERIIEGLAETIGWLLHGVDPRVAEWVLARAVPSTNPGRLVSTEAAILGEGAALQRAFEAGLVDHLPERRDDPEDVLDLRRPLAILGALGDLSATVTFSEVARGLRPRLDPRVYRVFDRLLREWPRPLGLEAPLVPHDLIGRDEVIARLAALFEPAREIRTAVLNGQAGIGKTAVAAAVCARLADRLEPVWLDFVGGPEAAWQRVADGLGFDTKRPDRTPAGLPGWLARVHQATAERDALIVVNHADAVPASELPAWLPAGMGVCAVLVVSRTPQPVLEREHDAIAISLGPLTLAEARTLVASLVPARKAEAVRRGKADGLLQQGDGDPLVLRTIAGLLKKESIEDVSARMKQAAQALARSALAAVDTEERAVVDALVVAAPAGSPRALVARMLGVNDVEPVLTRLADRALIELGPRRVSLKAGARAVAEREMGDDLRRELELEHAQAATAVMEVASKATDFLALDGVYQDTLLGLERMTAKCRSGEGPIASLVERLASVLLHYPRGNRTERLTRVIAGYAAALTVHSKETAPEQWAKDQANLGLALQRLPAGDRAENLHQAIVAYRAALTIQTRQAHPHAWAQLQNSLGVALCTLPAGDEAKNVLDAIHAFRAALTVWNEKAHRMEWARTQVNLGGALARLPSGDRAENLRQAVTSYRQALRVYTIVAFPDLWATTQNELGTALAALPDADHADHVRNAIDAYQGALTVMTRETYPGAWAQTQRNLGLALQRLPSGDRRQNLVDAIDAFRAALSVHTEEASPREGAATQADLDAALQALASLDATATTPQP